MFCWRTEHIFILIDIIKGVDIKHVLYDFLVTVKAAPHEGLIRTGQPKT